MAVIVEIQTPPYYAVIFCSLHTAENHQTAQQLGKEKWYKGYMLRISRVERDFRSVK